MRAAAHPMAPVPSTPNVLPESATIGSSQAQSPGRSVQRPFRTSASSAPRAVVSSSSSAIACCATESVE
jgi:hypothetical protein